MRNFILKNKPTQQIKSNNSAKRRKKSSIQSHTVNAFLHLQRSIGNKAVGQLIANQSNQKRTNNTGLPDHLKVSVENISGLSMDDVRVHPNSSEPARLHAHAYTQGTDIYVATGKEQYLPHEAWHVVQQKTGRVKSTRLYAKGASLNDNPALETEADQMAAKISQVGFSKPARLNHHFSVSSAIKPGVIQRNKKVGTDFGQFETTEFADLNDRGVKIKLWFHPDENKVDAKKIALAQSVKTFDESGKAYATTPTHAKRMVARGKSGAGYVIDAPGTTNNPIYFNTKNLGPTEELRDTPLSGNNPANPAQLGVNTNYELGSCNKENPTDTDKKKHSAGLYDEPQGRKKVGAGMKFETAAFAIEGADKNKYYGSVKWGYKLEGTARALRVNKEDIDRASKGKPTANFIAPAKLWNVGKTQGTLKVSANPATVYKMDGRTTESLAKDTKLKLLDTVGGGSEAMIKVEALNADGAGSGKLVYINVSDVKDMGDGSPTKKLPV